MEKNAMDLKIKLISKNAQIIQNRFSRTEKRLKENLKRTIAYGRVVKENSISKLMGSPLYKDALNRKYTYKALRFELVRMLDRMEPRHLREEQTKKRVDVARDEYEGVMRKNLIRITSPRTNRREEERLAKEKREKEKREEQERFRRRFMVKKDPPPPIENSLFFNDDDDDGEKEKGLTRMPTMGLTSKPHFQNPAEAKERPSPREQSIQEENALLTITDPVYVICPNCEFVGDSQLRKQTSGS